MRRAVLYRIGGIVVVVTGFMFLLMSITPLPNAANNGFSRNLLSSSSLHEITSYEFVEPLNKIVGISDDKIFLAGDSPTGLLAIDKKSGKTDTIVIRMNIPPDKMVPYCLEIDSNKLYLHLNNLQVVVSGSFSDDGIKVCSLNTQVFTKSVQISPEQLVIRTFNKDFSEQIFEKISSITGEKSKEKVVEELMDGQGGMSTDGMLKFEKKSGRLFYVEAFRNRFYCMDTGLNLLYKHRTIDTISTNAVGVATEDSGDSTLKLIPGMARKNVNRDILLDEKYLYIVSNLRADNQSHSLFNNSVSLDRYQIVDGSYNGSIIINKIRNKAFKSSKIYKDELYALYDGKIVVYDLKTK
ncbi:hypothetical protein [Chitinophaga caseinilytica]|uniref:Uncharacterized protein n=1 Tax=Chitinophaga caseinilytica TaxID=2267521 RepID=A0ABZ2ZA24_9BACT